MIPVLRSFIIAFPLALAAASRAAGESVTLRNGNVLSGDVIREGPDGLELQVGSGTIFIPRSSLLPLNQSPVFRAVLEEVLKTMEKGGEEKALAFISEAADDPALDKRLSDELRNILGGPRVIPAQASERAAILVRLARNLVSSHRWAADLCDRALARYPAIFKEIAPLWAGAKRELAREFLATTDRRAEGLDILEDLLHACPCDSKAVLALGEALRDAGDARGALELFFRRNVRAGDSSARDIEAAFAAARKAARDWSGLPRPVARDRDKDAILRTPHFIVRHRCSRDFAEALGRAAEFHFARTAGALGREYDLAGEWKNSAAFLIVEEEDKEDMNRSADLKWSRATTSVVMQEGGLLRRVIRVPASIELLAGPILPHEIGHAFFFALTRGAGGIPLWLHEGFALWCEPRVRKPYMRSVIRARLDAGERLPPEGFLLSTDYPAGDPELFYCLAFSLVEFLALRAKMIELVETAPALAGAAGPNEAARSFGFAGRDDFVGQWRIFALRQPGDTLTTKR